MDIRIPSPRVFLEPSPDPEPTKKAPRLQNRAPPGLQKVDNSTVDKSSKDSGGSKTRQGNSRHGTKSRNGCVSCRKRRLKCDETKPKCLQCNKRGVECEGYNKEFKWRFFDDTVTNKPTRPPVAKKAGTITPTNAPRPKANSLESGQAPTVDQGSRSDNETRPSSSQAVSSDSATDAPLSSSLPSWMSLGISTPGRTSPSQPELLHSDRADLNLHSSSTTSTGQLPELTLNDSSRSSPGLKAANTLNACSRSTDLIQSSTNTSNPNRPKTASPGDPGLPRTDWPLGLDFLIDADFGTEDVPDEYSLPDMSHLPWTFDPPSPADSETSATSSKYTGMSILRAPPSDPSSPEMLMLRFDRQTCGILSMKDGPSENPWRSHVWPLAKNSQALYHAILAMAAIHGTESQPQLKSVGMAHMTQSVRKFSLEMNKMSLEQALGTALALCLAEAWNDGPLTGIQHLKGARSLLSSVLAEHSAGLRPDLFDGEKAKCLRFLTCTFVYLDVMTRLTSTEELGNIDIEMLLRLSEEPFEGTAYQIDPRMGCATTLFPLLSRAADLILRVRKSTKNNLSVISEANELREQLLQWEPPDIDLFEQPEDVSSDARHALQTAEAYRRAMLLHLHHTVTELSSEPSQDQAMAVLSALAATPLSSRTTVVQVFPLLVGSCEVTEADDRQWVAQRWEGMMKRTQLANVASCWKVVQEAWRRRDIWTASQSQRLARTYSLNTPGNFEDEFTVEANPTKKHLGSALPSSARLAPRRQQVRLPRRHTDVSLLSGESEFTVRGNLHWLGVMSDFNCEVFIG